MERDITFKYFLITFSPDIDPSHPWYAVCAENEDYPECAYYDNGFKEFDYALNWINNKFKEYNGT